MKIKNILVVSVLSVIIAASLVFVVKGTHAEDQGSNQSADQTAVLAKLDQVLESQKAVMSQLDSMKQELNIIKVRITQQQ